MPRTLTNSEGKPIIPLSDEERYIFDNKGWLAIPGVLDESEMKDMREICCQLKFDWESMPERDRTTIAGPLEALCDHPRVVGFMQEFCGNDSLESEEGYGFRMEYSFMGMRLRKYKHDHYSPHGGLGEDLSADRCHAYRGLPGRAFSGLTQAVWELNRWRKETARSFSPAPTKDSSICLKGCARIATITCGKPTSVPLDLSSSSPRRSPTAAPNGKTMPMTVWRSSTAITPSRAVITTGIHTPTSSRTCIPNGVSFPIRGQRVEPGGHGSARRGLYPKAGFLVQRYPRCRNRSWSSLTLARTSRKLVILRGLRHRRACPVLYS